MRLRAVSQWRSSLGSRSGSRRDQRPRRGCAGSQWPVLCCRHRCHSSNSQSLQSRASWRRILGSGSVSPRSKRQYELIWVGLRLTALWLTELLGWTRTSLGRWVLATADVARIAVKASVVIRVFMTMLLGNLPAVGQARAELAQALVRSVHAVLCEVLHRRAMPPHLFAERCVRRERSVRLSTLAFRCPERAGQTTQTRPRVERALPVRQSPVAAYGLALTAALHHLFWSRVCCG